MADIKLQEALSVRNVSSLESMRISEVIYVGLWKRKRSVPNAVYIVINRICEIKYELLCVMPDQG